MKINSSLQTFGSILLAKAVSDLFPDAKLANNKIDDFGFDYLFELSKPLSINDLPKIKKQMQKIIDSAPTINYLLLDKEQAKNHFINNQYKAHLIDEIKGQISLIKIGDKYFDICSALGFSKFSIIKQIELDNVSGMYWLNNANNKQLTAIHGTVFESKEVRDEFVKFCIETRSRDHRLIGSQLEIFTFDPLAGQGLPIWLPNGATIMYEINCFIHELLVANDYLFVNSPVLGTKQLYETSGHWEHYRENMFPQIRVEQEEYVLRPMTCPHHLVIYKQRPRSYKELPYKVAEHAILHRYETSGSLTGLERVRNMQLIDTHIICTLPQIKEVVKKCYEIIEKASSTFNINIHSVVLALHDAKDTEKFFKDEKKWLFAEEMLEKIVRDLGIKYERAVGDAAFYGPKIDIQVKNALNKIITAYTIQLDFLLPERFKLEYIDETGHIQRPVLIHASVIGTLERFIAIYLEQTRGVFPLWLAPTGVAIIPVNNETHLKYCQQIATKLKQKGIRVKINDLDDRLAKKIRDAQVKKIPYQVIIGDNEVKNGTISYRKYGEQDSKTLKTNNFIKLLVKLINNKN